MLLLFICCHCFLSVKMVPRDFSSFGSDCSAFEWLNEDTCIFFPPQTFERRSHSQDFEGEENDD